MVPNFLPCFVFSKKTIKDCLWLAFGAHLAPREVEVGESVQGHLQLQSKSQGG